MLKYFKYFAVVSFILVLVAAFFAGVYFRSFAANTVLKKSAEEDTVALAQNFADSIVCKYEPILARLADTPLDKWAEDKYFDRFGKFSMAVLGVIPAAKISLYNSRGDEFFTTSDVEMVYFEDQDRSLMEKGRSKGAASELIPSMGFYDKNGTLHKGSYVHSFVAIDTAKCTLPEGRERKNAPMKIIMEVFYDVTDPWNQLYFFQIIVSAGIVATFVILYLALFITSRKAEKIINKQHEEKLNLEKAKTAAETQNQQKSMFLANVSHELRTPLNAIIGFSEIIKDEVMGPLGHPQYKEYVTDINSSGVHLLSLINDILDYSKAEARKLDVEAVDIDLSKIAHSCLRLVEPRANEAKVKLTENLPTKHVVMSADPKRMKQIILNLLSNSVKFTQEGGEVALTIQEDVLDGIVILTVADNGIGIAAKDISKAMAPFGQIDSSISRKYEGTGLGLPLTKKLTELMGGKFDIKSEVGLGTTVILTFPIMHEKGEKEAREF